MILSLDGDFLSSGFPGFHKYARQFSARRNPDLKEKMVRFYAAESTPTNTGGKADHRIPVRASEVEQFGARGRGGTWELAVRRQPRKNGVTTPSMIANDLQKHKGAAVVVVGENQPPAVHALAHAMNAGSGRGGQHGRLHRAGGSASRSIRLLRLRNWSVK